MTSTWDIAGRRTRIAHPDGFYVDQDYLVTGELTVIRENGATSGVGVLATYACDDLGRRASLTRGDGVGAELRLRRGVAARRSSPTISSAPPTTRRSGFGYNPASPDREQHAEQRRLRLDRPRQPQPQLRGQRPQPIYGRRRSITPTYDANGNLTSDGSDHLRLQSENLLTSASGGIAPGLRPALRLYQTSGGAPARPSSSTTATR